MRTEMINLMKSAAPFVGKKGKAMIQLAAHINDLMASNAAKETIRVFSTLNPPQAMTVSQDTDLQSLEDSNPFGLFLILILLILATESVEAKRLAKQKSKIKTNEDIKDGLIKN